MRMLAKGIASIKMSGDCWIRNISIEGGNSLSLFYGRGGFSFTSPLFYYKSILKGRESIVDWNRLKAEYIKGGISYRKLADKHKVPFHTLRKQAAKEKWREARDECVAKTATKIIEAESDKQAQRYERLLKVSDDLLAVVEDAVRSFQVGELALDKSALKSLSGTIKDIKDIQNIKTELDIAEQKARIKNLQKQAEADDGAVEVSVVFGNGEEKWAK